MTLHDFVQRAIFKADPLKDIARVLMLVTWARRYLPIELRPLPQESRTLH